MCKQLKSLVFTAEQMCRSLEQIIFLLSILFRNLILVSLCYSQWLSPEGCIMFSLQLHIPLASRLGQRLSLIQHLIGTAMANAIVTQKGYEVSSPFFMFIIS